jgi:uncharacterized protein (TIGR00369 family)
LNLLTNLPPGLTGLEQLRQLIEMGGRPPIGDTLHITLVDADDGFAAFEGHPSVAAFNAMGTVHGGYAAVLLDSACGCAGHSRLSAIQAYTTLELKVTYHKPMDEKTGQVHAEGRVITMGRRVAFVEASLKNEAGTLYATATSTLLIFDR